MSPTNCYYTVEKAAAEWHVTKRRVAQMCSSGKIAGAKRAMIDGRSVWVFPVCDKPADERFRYVRIFKAEREARKK